MGPMCTVTENNKLIAEFMGVRNIDDTKYIENLKEMRADGLYFEQGYMTSELKYDTDWNWLMEVVERINNTGRFEVVIQKGFCYVSDESNELTLSCPASNTLEATYQAVVEFIKWYNNE